VVILSNKNRFDLWLERLSYISQSGLFFLTIFTIYYTVIPVFQNASLQESISQKEIELKKLRDESDVLYKSLKIEYLNKFQLSLIFNCNPMTAEMMKQPDTASNKKNFKQEMSIIRQLFDTDIYACMIKQADSNISLSKMRVEDRVLVKKLISESKSNIEKLKNKYLLALNDQSNLRKIGREKSTFMRSLEENGFSNDTEESAKYFNENYILLGASSLLSDYGDDINNFYRTIFK